ncbi:MAG TPA: pantetheine-phosphate adenylyltransferase [Eubacteriales bacterium]|nr:pantetheine-phosphate adenylyltransferase [Clostridia bacterium]HRV73815.1 pantetheine-phosphate adenylyltransferase [Eubacteriales bacterium]
MRACVYPGSFDPFTIGHRDVLEGASRMFDKVYLGVLNNITKHPVFGVEERVAMAQRVVDMEGYPNVEVLSFDGLVVEFTRKVGAQYIIRGLRASTDFEYEFQIDAINYHLDSSIQTVYFMAKPAHSFLSSSNVKEICYWGGSIEGLVPSYNLEEIRERLARGHE